MLGRQKEVNIPNQSRRNDVDSQNPQVKMENDVIQHAPEMRYLQN